jgi:hypothetical protein
MIALPTDIEVQSNFAANDNFSSVSSIPSWQDAATVFLQMLHPDEDHGCTFQTFDDKKDRKHPALKRVLHGTLEQHRKELEAINEAGGGIFVTINRTDFGGRKTENITQVRANFVDLDGAPLKPLRDANPRPHIIIETSPGRYAGYWFVEDEPLDQFSNIQKRLAMTFNSDPSVHDLPRVMRLPGFYHNKSEPFLSRIIARHHIPKYRPADLEPLLGHLAQPKTYEVKEGNDFFRNVNTFALMQADVWVPRLFPDARKSGHVWRISSRFLGRAREEDLSISPEGIKDFGEHDMQDPKDGKRTPIDLLIDPTYKIGMATAREAALYLCDLIHIKPSAWAGKEKRQTTRW